MNEVEHIILGIFCTVLAVLTFAGSAREKDQRENWVECDAQITDVFETTDSDAPGADNREWYCTVEYLREDGTKCVEEDVHLYDPVKYGDTIRVIYDPDSNKMKPGGPPEDNDRVADRIFFCGTAIAAAAFYLTAIRKIVRGRRKTEKNS